MIKKTIIFSALLLSSASVFSEVNEFEVCSVARAKNVRICYFNLIENEYFLSYEENDSVFYLRITPKKKCGLNQYFPKGFVPCPWASYAQSAIASDRESIYFVGLLGRKTYLLDIDKKTKKTCLTKLIEKECFGANVFPAFGNQILITVDDLEFCSTLIFDKEKGCVEKEVKDRAVLSKGKQGFLWAKASNSTWREKIGSIALEYVGKKFKVKKKFKINTFGEMLCCFKFFWNSENLIYWSVKNRPNFYAQMNFGKAPRKVLLSKNAWPVGLGTTGQILFFQKGIIYECTPEKQKAIFKIDLEKIQSIYCYEKTLFGINISTEKRKWNFFIHTFPESSAVVPEKSSATGKFR